MPDYELVCLAFGYVNKCKMVCAYSYPHQNIEQKSTGDCFIQLFWIFFNTRIES